MILFLCILAIVFLAFNFGDLVTCLVGAVFVTSMIVVMLVGFAFLLRLFLK